MNWLKNVDPSWDEVLYPHASLILEIENRVRGHSINPSLELVFRAFSFPIKDTKVVIFGQDPYPTLGHATGLAFSVPSEIRRLPLSLKNIFLELHDDIGGELRANGDLSDWASQGVALINRILTVPVGVSQGHRDLGWQPVLDSVAKALGERGVIAILWGNYAQQLSSYFDPAFTILSAHPSPLSAYRGFFGSHPFSKTNQLLESKSKQAIDWLGIN